VQHRGRRVYGAELRIGPAAWSNPGWRCSHPWLEVAVLSAGSAAIGAGRAV